jgi:hypothetical protein
MLDVHDADGDAPLFSLLHAPVGMTVDGAGLMSWTPVDADRGLHEIVVEVTDGQGGSQRQTFWLFVEGAVATLTVQEPLASTAYAPTPVTVAYRDEDGAVRTDFNGSSTLTGLPLPPDVSGGPLEAGAWIATPRFAGVTPAETLGATVDLGGAPPD